MGQLGVSLVEEALAPKNTAAIVDVADVYWMRPLYILKQPPLAGSDHRLWWRQRDDG